MLSKPFLQQLGEQSQKSNATGEWPRKQLAALGEAGVLKWLVPQAYGGDDFDTAQLVEGYLQLAGACLVSTFVLTQRNAAVMRLKGSENEELKQRLLPDLCGADLFATVGVSHLTTSRQHLNRPSVQVTESPDGYLFNGFVPWVTGATFADYIVTGGTLPDGRQILAIVDTQSKGVLVEPAAKLLALNASFTGPVILDNAIVPRADVIAGPVPAVMKSRAGGGGAGGLTTSSLALGLAGGAIDCIQSECDQRPELVDIAEPLHNELQEIKSDLRVAVTRAPQNCSPHQSSESIRQRANSIVLRATQAHLAISKGAGFSQGHPAERFVREAMFFLVWSCPQPVVHANLRELVQT